MPSQPPDPRHYEMKIPPEPDQATLKKDESERPPADDENRDTSNTAKDNNVMRGDDKPQSVRNEK